MYVSQTVASATNGRVFGVIGISRMRNPGTNACKASSSGETGSDMDTSGYSSTSSLESTEEERRVTPSEEKIKCVWKCWSQHLDSFSGPLCSTPKPDAENVVLKKRVKLRCYSRPLTAVKKMLCSNSSKRDGLVINHCCIRNPFSPARVLKNRTEKYLHENVPNNCAGIDRMQSLDSGLNFQLSTRSQASVKQNRKFRPYIAPSSDGGILTTGRRATNESLPLRVSWFKGALDESMAEFLSNVNQENLASYLQFFDNVTKNANLTPSYFKV